MDHEWQLPGRSDAARLVIADDHDLVRAGLRSLFAGEQGLEIVGEAADGHRAVELCRRLEPDLLLIDVRMPGLDGLAATRAVKDAHPETGVIIVTMHESADYLVEAARAGVAGYILKGATRRDFVAAVRQVLRGEPMLPPELAPQLVRRLAAEDGQAAGPAPSAPPSPAGSSLDRLTPREREVLRLIARGQTNQEIARRLTVSLSTVKTHVEHIIAKLGASDRTQAAVLAAALGLLTPRPPGSVRSIPKA